MKPKIPEKIIRTDRWVAPVGRLHSNKIKLDLNENSNTYCEVILDALNKMTVEDIVSYPEYDNLLSLLASYTGHNVSEIVITNGADQAIDIVLRLLFDENSIVTMPSPAFSMYDHVCNLIGLNVKHIPYEKNCDTFAFPYENTLLNLDTSNGLILCSPNNPLGSGISKDQLTKLIKKTEQLNIPCIIDEAYFEYYGSTSIETVSNNSHVIIIRTMSKAFGMAGVRLGYVISDPYISKALLKIRGPWDINAVAVKLGEAVLENKEFFLAEVKELRLRKEILKDILIQNGFFVMDTLTNFLLIESPSINLIEKWLISNNVLVTLVENYPNSFGLLKNMARITTPSKTELEKLKQLLKTDNFKKIK